MNSWRLNKEGSGLIVRKRCREEETRDRGHRAGDRS